MEHIEYRERIQFTVRSLVSGLELFTSIGALLHCCSVRLFQKHSPPTYISVGPKEVDELEFLFVAQSCSDDGCFGVVSLLLLDSLGAHITGWFNR